MSSSRPRRARTAIFPFKGLFPTSAYEIFPYWDKQSALMRLKVESGPEGLTNMLPGPIEIIFAKAKNGVITDSATCLDWYVGPDQGTDWNQVKAGTENLTAARGGWGMPTVPELKALYQFGVGPNNMDPILQTTGTWVWSGHLKNAS